MRVAPSLAADEKDRLWDHHPDKDVFEIEHANAILRNPCMPHNMIKWFNPLFPCLMEQLP